MLGAKVHTCARDETQLQERLREWQAKGFQVTTSVCDVSSRDQREKLMETVSSLFQGKLSILVSVCVYIYKLLLLLVYELGSTMTKIMLNFVCFVCIGTQCGNRCTKADD